MFEALVIYVGQYHPNDFVITGPSDDVEQDCKIETQLPTAVSVMWSWFISWNTLFKTVFIFGMRF